LLLQQSLQISSAPLTTRSRSATDRGERRSGALRPYPVCGTVVCAGTVRFTDPTPNHRTYRTVVMPPIWRSPGGCVRCFAKALKSGRSRLCWALMLRSRMPRSPLWRPSAITDAPSGSRCSPAASTSPLRHRGLGSALGLSCHLGLAVPTRCLSASAPAYAATTARTCRSIVLVAVSLAAQSEESQQNRAFSRGT